MPWRAFRLVWVIGTVGAVLSLTLAEWFAREAKRLDAARFFQMGNAIGGALEHRVEPIEAMLRNLQRIFNAKETPDLADWDEFMNRVSPVWNIPVMLAMGYATNATVAGTVRRLEEWTRPGSSRDRTEFYRLPEDVGGEKAWSVWLADVHGDDLRPAQPFASEEPEIEVAIRWAHFRRYREPAEPQVRLGRGLACEPIGDRWRITEHGRTRRVCCT